MPASSAAVSLQPAVPLSEGPVSRHVFRLALPTLVQQFLMFFVGLTDVWLSGEIDAAATTAVGLASYVGWIANLLVSTVSIGTTALVARHCGAGEPERANQVMHTAILAGLFAAFLMSALLFLAVPLLTGVFQLEGPTSAVTARYLRIDALGHIFSGLLLVFSAGLRGAGDMRRPMLVLGFMCLLNMAISWILVRGVGGSEGGTYLLSPLGVDGIVFGTVAAKIIAMALMVGVFIRGAGPLRWTSSLFRIDQEILRRLFRIGRMAAADGLMHWAGQFAFLAIVRSVKMPGITSDQIFAAHVVGVQVEALSYLPAIAWGQAAATMIGQNLGAERKDRAVRSSWIAALQCAALALFLAVIFYFSAEQIYAAMHEDAAVGLAGVPAFRAMSFLQVPLVVLLVLRAALHGAGDTAWPMISTSSGILLVRLPGAWLGGVTFSLGLLGAWLGMFADILVRCAVISYRVLSRRWLNTDV